MPLVDLTKDMEKQEENMGKSKCCFIKYFRTTALDMT